MKFITGATYDKAIHKVRSKIKSGHTSPKSKFYSVWDGMKQRCLNKNSTRYMDYGGRGIGVCEEWLQFTNFLLDMEESFYLAERRYPGKILQLDREDNSLGYCKSNCRWTTATINMLNQRGRSGLGKGIRKRPSGRYTARVQINGKGIHIGNYATAEEAIEARKVFMENLFSSQVLG